MGRVVYFPMEGDGCLLTEILRLYCQNLGADYTIREIARHLGGSYSHVYTKMQEYIQQQYFLAMRRGPSLLCTINRQHPLLPAQLTLLAQQEFIRWQAASTTTNQLVAEMIQRVEHQLRGNLHTLLVFGSYAKGSAEADSDLDVLLIVPDKSQADEFVAREAATLEMRFGVEVNPIVIEPQMLCGMWQERGMNVAKEAFEHKVIAYGAEKFWRLALEAR